MPKYVITIAAQIKRLTDNAWNWYVWEGGVELDAGIEGSEVGAIEAVAAALLAIAEDDEHRAGVITHGDYKAE